MLNEWKSIPGYNGKYEEKCCVGWIDYALENTG